MRTYRIFAILLLLGSLSASAQSVRQLYRQAREWHATGDYARSLKSYRQILDLLPGDAEYADDRAFYLRPYTDLLLLTGGYEDVEDLLGDPAYSRYITLQINLAAALGYQGKYDEATSMLDRLVRRDDAGDFKGRMLQNAGFIYMESGDYRSAVDRFRESLPSFKGYERNIVESNMALCLARLGRFAEANSCMARALKGLKAGGKAKARDYIRALRKSAEIHYLQNDRAKALSGFRTYFNLEKDWLMANLSGMSVTDRLNLWMSEKTLLSKCFMLEGYAPEFLYEVAMFRRLTSLLGMRDLDKLKTLLAVGTDDIRRSLKTGEAAVEFISHAGADGNERYAAIVLPKKGNARFVRLFDVDMIYRPDAVGVSSIFDVINREDPDDKNALYTDTGLADMVWRPIVLVLPRDVSTVYFAPEGIFHFWGIENMPFGEKDKYELHRVTSTASLAGRTEPVNRATRSSLVIGGLNYSSLPQDSTVAAPNHDAAEMIADRVGVNDIFNYLPGTRSEVDSISSRLDEANLKHSVGEADLKAMMPKFNLVHIATHGYALDLGIRKRPEWLNDSIAIDQSLNAAGLALTGANIACRYPDREDGLLSAREICDLDLSNVDFVILSACQTAQGDLTDEGAAGLVRGLKNAGVKTVMATLWSVDDRSTMMFMQEFYRLSGQGASKHEAYVGAQNHLKAYTSSIPYRRFSPATLSRERKTYYNTTKYDAPYYWAPFILIDDI
mgnify:FL=1